VVIASAGESPRMRTPIPRPLLDLAGQTLIERQVEAIRSAMPECEIIAVLGHQGERIARSLPVGIRYIIDQEHDKSHATGSIGRGLAASRRRGAAIILMGDLLIDHKVITAVSEPGSSAILIDRGGGIRPSEVGVSCQDRHVTRLDFGLPVKWGQVCRLEGPMMDEARHTAMEPCRRMMFAWEFINHLIDWHGHPLAVEAPDGLLVEIDSLTDAVRSRHLLEPVCVS
jgi:hypothetical protein